MKPFSTYPDKLPKRGAGLAGLAKHLNCDEDWAKILLEKLYLHTSKHGKNHKRQHVIVCYYLGVQSRYVSGAKATGETHQDIGRRLDVTGNVIRTEYRGGLRVMKYLKNQLLIDS